ncbi:stage V sporulation T C-terminal domain-containing protein [Ruminococcus sp.]|uniref:stage V sporulation T C-terminal domain-containing protein n=1 Tax=Ruminococcus sp. TaxID=41978 RepID=UPI002E784CF2|nr:stage V sporulation T C-terminal domain-containing protein [Ruminococcus sp.]MEE1264044.1 stage V sporulation T C-terminal domain-containing protein [Ruminococcus sp.]
MGIIRRVNNSGYIDIPSEIRQSLHIRDGELLEIYATVDGELIYQKYSSIKKLSRIATEYAHILASISQMPVLICDRDHVVAASGVSTQEYLKCRVTQMLEEYMEDGCPYFSDCASDIKMQPVEGFNHPATIIYPIVSVNNVVGAVVFLESKLHKSPSEVEFKTAQTAAAFLGKQIDEYAI